MNKYQLTFLIKRYLYMIGLLVSLLCPKLRICPKLKFQFRAIKLKISNLGNAILLPQFKIGANLKLRNTVPQVNHRPNLKLRQIEIWENAVPQVNYCPNL